MSVRFILGYVANLQACNNNNNIHILVIGGLGCAIAILDVYLQKVVINRFYTLELLQQIVVLGSTYIRSYILHRYL